jgi:glycosyltransferase involved in cell wall biosynthesis
MVGQAETTPSRAPARVRPAVPTTRFVNRPSRILMTGDATGGCWTCSLELARALEPHGVSVALALMGEPPDAAQRGELKGVPNLELLEGRYRLEWMPAAWADVDAAARWLLELRDGLQPDLVHLNGYAHATLPWGVPTLVAARWCALSWWTAARRQPVPPEWSRYRSEVRRGLAAADVVVAPTRAMLDCLQQHHGPVPAGRVVVQGREPSLFPPRGKQGYVLAAARRWNEAHNLGRLDEAARGIDWPVFLAGELPAFEAPRFAHSLGLLPRPLLASWLGRASIFAWPARYEPFGVSVLEAALAGCALVLADIPSLRELWDEAAIFVDPDDGPGLTRALGILIRDATRRGGLAQRARARALDLSPARMAQGYLEACALAGMAAAQRELAVRDA